MYPNCMPDFMIKRFSSYFVHKTALLHKTTKSEREIIQSNSYRILSKVNQVIYTLDTICMSNIMTLAQAFLQVFCSQGCFSTQNDKAGKGRCYKILSKVNQLIYTFLTFCMPNIMTLAQAVLQIFCSQGS